jgi:soluble lytic murein transglycosylase-like protein
MKRFAIAILAACALAPVAGNAHTRANQSHPDPRPAASQIAAAPLWIDRREAQPWLPALTAAADRTGMPVALVAEIIGWESGFKNIKNPHSSAAGFGQQITGNAVMARERLNRAKPADSILGAAIQFREALERTGSLQAAARSYGTIAGLPSKRQAAILAAFQRAARGNDAQIVFVRPQRTEMAATTEALLVLSP